MPTADRAATAVLAVAVGLVVAGAVALFMLATSQGTGLSPDSVTYLHAARNLAVRHTLITEADRVSHLVRPTHYPPLYSATLAVPGLLTGGVETPARWVQGIVVAVTGGLFALLLGRYARPAAVLAGLGILVLSSGFLVEINGYVLSEGLFLAWSLATLLLLLLWLDRHEGHANDHRALLVASAVTAAAAAVTRFVGVALIATGAVAIVWFDRRRSWRRGALFLSVSALPLAVWTAYSRSTGEGAVGQRTLALHPPPAAKWRAGLRTIGTWVIPQRLTEDIPRNVVEIVGLSVALTFLGVLVVMARGRPTVEDASLLDECVARLGRVASVFVAVYLALVVATISLVDASTPLDRRILLPVFVVGLITVVPAVDRLVCRRPGWAPRAIAGVALVALLAANRAGTAADVGAARRHGLGYASVTWRRSPLVSAVRRLPPGTTVYSNAAGALLILTGVRAQSIAPRAFGNGSGVNRGYETQLGLMAQRVGNGQSVIVWFESAHHYFGADLATLRRVMGRPPTMRTADGALFGPLPAS